MLAFKVEDVSDDDDDGIVGMIVLIDSTAPQSNHGDCLSPDDMSDTNLLKIYLRFGSPQTY